MSEDSNFKGAEWCKAVYTDNTESDIAENGEIISAKFRGRREM